MKIKDVLMDAGVLLGLNDECKVLNEITIETEQSIIDDNIKLESLFKLIKYSIRELCTNYIPMLNKVLITTEDKRFPLNEITNFIRMNGATQNGEMVQFKIINRNLVFEEDGEYEIEYSTYPEINSVFDEIDYLLELSPDAIVMGLCAYYSLAHGMFSEFEEFHEKYVSKAESLKVLKCFNLPCRRWE